MNNAPLNEQTIWDSLRLVIDPEIGCNIVDLGLVYSLEIQDTKVLVKMTLTTRGCPMHESLIWGVRNAVLALEGVAEVQVDLVWDPPWNPAMMTEYGRSCVGYRE